MDSILSSGNCNITVQLGKQENQEFKVTLNYTEFEVSMEEIEEGRKGGRKEGRQTGSNWDIEKAQLVKYLPHKHKDPSLTPSTYRAAYSHLQLQFKGFYPLSGPLKHHTHMWYTDVETKQAPFT